MTLALPQELEEEMLGLITMELPASDNSTTKYLARLFSTGKIQTWEEIKFNWAGLRAETPTEEDKLSVFGKKLYLSRKIGDGCLTLSAFYRGDDKPASIRALPISGDTLEMSSSQIASVDKRRFANEYEPTPLDKPKRFKSSPIEPGLEIAGLGRAGYNTAGLYSTMIGEEDGHTYHALSQQFLRIIAKVGPAILRKYLGVINPPQRIVIYTPHGEMLFRLRNSVS